MQTRFDIATRPKNLAEIIQGKSRALRVNEVAAVLNVSERQIYKLAAERRIPAFRIGGSLRFDPATLASWLRSRMLPTTFYLHENGAPSQYGERRRSCVNSRASA